MTKLSANKKILIAFLIFILVGIIVLVALLVTGVIGGTASDAVAATSARAALAAGVVQQGVSPKAGDPTAEQTQQAAATISSNQSICTNTTSGMNLGYVGGGSLCSNMYEAGTTGNDVPAWIGGIPQSTVSGNGGLPCYSSCKSNACCKMYQYNDDGTCYFSDKDATTNCPPGSIVGTSGNWSGKTK
jgi:hypothetical protein